MGQWEAVVVLMKLRTRSKSIYSVYAVALTQTVDSAGTSSEHEGDEPDSRSIAVAKRNGIDISTHKAQQLTGKLWTQYDVILASVCRAASCTVERSLKLFQQLITLYDVLLTGWTPATTEMH
jgi:protein-tyrosine-phosphatase